MTAVRPVKDNRRESVRKATLRIVERKIIIKNYFFKEPVSDSVGSIFYAIFFFATLIKPESFLETFILI